MKIILLATIYGFLGMMLEAVSLKDYYSKKMGEEREQLTLKQINRKGQMKTIFKDYGRFFFYKDIFYKYKASKIDKVKNLETIQKPSERVCREIKKLSADCRNVFIYRVEKNKQIELNFYKRAETKEINFTDPNNTKLSYTVGFVIFQAEKSLIFEFPNESDIDVETGIHYLDYVDLIIQPKKGFLVTTWSGQEFQELLLFQLDFESGRAQQIDKEVFGEE